MEDDKDEQREGQTPINIQMENLQEAPSQNHCFEVSEDRLIEKLIERMTKEGFCRIFNPPQDIKDAKESYLRNKDWVQQSGEPPHQEPSATEITPPYIKDMYRLPFDDVTLSKKEEEMIDVLNRERYCVDKNEYLRKKVELINKRRDIPKKEEKEEFKTTDLKLLREFFVREWKATKELWKTWRSK